MQNAESKNISRDELYELIWSKPAAKLAKGLAFLMLG